MLILPRSSVANFIARSIVVYFAPVCCRPTQPPPAALVSPECNSVRTNSVRVGSKEQSHSVRVVSKEQIILCALDPRNKSFYSRWIQGTSHSIRVRSKEQVVLFALNPRNKSFYPRWTQGTSRVGPKEQVIQAIRIVSKEQVILFALDPRNQITQKKAVTGEVLWGTEKRLGESTVSKGKARKKTSLGERSFGQRRIPPTLGSTDTATLYTTNKMYSSTHQSTNNI